MVKQKKRASAKVKGGSKFDDAGRGRPIFKMRIFEVMSLQLILSALSLSTFFSNVANLTMMAEVSKVRCLHFWGEPHLYLIGPTPNLLDFHKKPLTSEPTSHKRWPWNFVYTVEKRSYFISSFYLISFQAKVQSHIQISLPHFPFHPIWYTLHQIGKGILERNVCISFCVSDFSLTHTHTHQKNQFAHP